MRAAKVQASLRIRAVSPEPPLLAHTSSESRGTFRQKAGSLAPLNGWACAVKICHDGMLEDTNSLDGAHIPNGLVGSPFPILVVSDVLLHFYLICDRISHKQTVQTLIRCRILRHLILVCTVCQGPKNGTLGMKRLICVLKHLRG